jgi:hypothetical protein
LNDFVGGGMGGIIEVYNLINVFHNFQPKMILPQKQSNA